MYHSYLSVLAGSVIAVFSTWALIVNVAMTTIITTGNPNNTQLTVMRYGYADSQPSIAVQAIGNASNVASNTSLIKCMESKDTILKVLAPRTFRIPISFVR